MKSFFITTAIDYTNGAPHIGHAYEKVLADVIARYHRLKKEEVFYLTGVDQHGQKVQQSAEKEGIAPQIFVDQVTAKFRALWAKLGIQNDGWAATTDASHKTSVQILLQRLFDEGQLYKAKQSGYYSVRQEQFLTEKERGPDGEFGPEWGEVVLVEEENYYFKLAEHKDWLLALLKSRPELVVPNFRMAELINAVEKLAGDLCISRPKSRLTWGIELPFDTDYVTYVWFDALVNYISFAPGFDPKSKIQNSEFHGWWPALHVIGKDIMIPAHGVYWPIMLKAIGFADKDIPTLLVHGWWNSSGEKMSKSLGNVVDPDGLVDLVQTAVDEELRKQKTKDAEKGKPTLSDAQIAEISGRCGPEALRYYLMSDIVTGKDSNFSLERLFQCYNVDLANGLGNLLNRALNMTKLYRAGILRVSPHDDPTLANLRTSIVDGVCRADGGYCSSMEAFETHAALNLVGAAVNTCNELVESSAPWKLAKDPAAADHLDAVLYHLAESLRIIAVLISPVLPEAARNISIQLGLKATCDLAETTWGGLKDGHQIGDAVPLFPRIKAPV